MSKVTSYRERSRVDYGFIGEHPTGHELQVGELLRIADAMELMVKRYQELVENRDRYKGWYEEKRAECKSLEAEIAALRNCLNEWQLAYRSLSQRMADSLFQQMRHPPAPSDSRADPEHMQ